MPRIETIILENLINDNNEYFRTVIPYLKEEYFDSKIDKAILKFIKTFANKHNKPPTRKILGLMAKEYDKFTQDEYNEAVGEIDSFDGKEENYEWLVERTETFCKDKAVYNSIMQAITIIDGKDETLNREAIPSILQDALSISFDRAVGHDFYDDIEERYDFYHRKEERLPFHLDMFNKITKGGLPRKTLNILLAGTNVGKSAFMCDHAAGVIRSGKNALYITLEMAEERIAERIDCNLLDCTIDEVEHIKRPDFISRLTEMKSKHHGTLVIKEYPTSSAHTGHFKSLLEELKLKKNFRPDIIYVDYVNICASLRMKSGGNHNSYTIIKAVAEELRSLAVEYNLPILTATQTTRSGSTNSDVDLTDTSECIWVGETVTLRDGTEKKIGDISLGDQITSNDNYKTTMIVHHPKNKECVKITLASGKTITVSKNHTFPTNSGRKSINTGLKIGDKLSS